MNRGLPGAGDRQGGATEEHSGGMEALCIMIREHVGQNVQTLYIMIGAHVGQNVQSQIL